MAFSVDMWREIYDERTTMTTNYTTAMVTFIHCEEFFLPKPLIIQLLHVHRSTLNYL